MKREIVKIDRELCNGCGECIPNCHEGALQMIDGKATLVSELMCDGLGACIGHCPQGAITIEEREAAPYDEVAVIKEIIPQGKNVMIAHLSHLKEHNQSGYLKQGVSYLKEIENELPFPLHEVISKVHNLKPTPTNQPTMNKPEFVLKMAHEHHGGGCPGSKAMSFAEAPALPDNSQVSGKSELRQWPVQMHLINPMAEYFINSDLLLAADCVAFSMGNFHQTWLKGKSLAILCPKLDSNTEVYLQKLINLVNDAKINTITVLKMQVPCCGGILQMAKLALQQASRKVPIKSITVGIQGEILSEEWV
ncbi:MAG: 4Fe-4S ferredoxin [Bacteroidales bacterium]|nr:4Fe-4S ferredoxin [Bacteroidales bacterium]MCF8456904.1 4Fe-4S ferredoxin [Bacteroidales bacterium]